MGESSIPTLWLADHHLGDSRGHHMNYNRALAQAAEASGWNVRILCKKGAGKDALPGISPIRIFRDDLRARPPGWAAGSHRLLGALDRISAFRFRGDLARGMRGVAGGDVVFAQMLAPRHLRAWMEWHSACGEGSRPSLVLHLGYDPSRFVGYPGLAAAVRALRHDAHCVTDSERLAPAYEKILGVPVSVLPHVVPLATPQPGGRADDSPPQILSLGNPRREKGFLDLAEAAKTAEGLRFVFQVNDPDPECREAVGALRARNSPAIRLIENHLDEREYFRHLQESDVVAVPYHLDTYRDRTSGIFCEALVAGKPVIATRGSWMSTEVEKHSLGWLVPERDPAGLRDVLRRLPAELPGVSARSRELAAAYRQHFSGGQFIAGLRSLISR